MVRKINAQKLTGFYSNRQAKVVRTQTEDKTVEIQAFQGFPLPPAPCYSCGPPMVHWLILIDLILTLL